ncbi:hypothetical protein DNK47_02215 [Mycoplasma wenyonii]|uniref:DUF31 domain-containing protein n=1 Tax=Mycoplasma wenyonii TaxID=65123 RepID=A0A328PJG9_9MOLU|nr:hypothetical protein [Mycoplasma wenyonii]RAO94972.1 hypothetical protein DNK47_02215 [Mycoplasma wenyonii]
MAINKLALAFPIVPASVVLGTYKLWNPNVPEHAFISEFVSSEESKHNFPTFETFDSVPTLETVSQEEENHNLDSIDTKRFDKEIADKVFEKLDDYSFRIFWSCGVGTGWILDYEIPEGKDKYPTVWYIATAAHVINGYKFAENPYEQELSSPLEETKMLRRRLAHRTHYYLPWYARLSMWDHGTTTCDISNRYGYSDLNIVKASNGAELKGEYGGWLNKRIEEPKLFYAAFDLFDKNPELGIEENNYKDFAVLEIKFKDPEYAKQVTNNFAGKYNVDTTDAINVFAKPLDEKYDTETIQKLDENFFELGYPKGKKGKYSQSKSWDEEKGESYKLLNKHWDLHYSPEQKKIRGFGNANKGLYKVTWNGKRRTDIGHFHLLGINQKYRLEGGASGSLFVDKNGDLLGIHGGGGEQWIISNSFKR